MENNTLNSGNLQQPIEDIRPEYLVIPSEILYRDDLNDGEKITAAMLKFLKGKKGYLWWTNKRLAELLNTSQETIKRRLSKLKQKKLIESHYARRKHVRYVRYLG